MELVSTSNIKAFVSAFWKRFTVAQRNLKNLQIIGIECDVADESSVKHAYEVIIATFGRIDAVVASAGTHFNFSFYLYLIS